MVQRVREVAKGCSIAGRDAFLLAYQRGSPQMLLLNILPLQSVAWAWIPSVVGVAHVIHLQKSGGAGLWSKDDASAIDAILWPSRTKIS